MSTRNPDESQQTEALESLAAKTCQACTGEVPPLRGAKLLPFATQLGHGWHIVHEHNLHKRFAFPDFVSALRFVNAIGEVAEKEGHHPDLHLGWGKVEVTIWTHKIDGLTESDFVLAAKVEKLPR